MKAIYLVRRHRLAPAHFQGKHRKTRVYLDDYEVVYATPLVAVANLKKSELENSPVILNGVADFKYSIGRIAL